MKVSKRVMVLLLACAMIFTVFAGCSSTPATSSAPGTSTAPAATPAKDTLTIALLAAPAGLFPNNTDVYSAEIFCNVFDALLTNDANGALQPALAASWSWTTATELTFKLRNDVTFQNGDKMTADDVVYSFTYYTTETKLATARPNYTKVEKVDDYTVKFTFAAASPLAINRFASPQMAVLDQKTYKGNEATSAWKPNGTGAYKFAKKENDIVYLERNDNYWGTKAKIKTLIFKPITDDQARLVALENGEVDIGDRISQTTFTTAKANGKLNCITGNANAVYSVVMNPNDPVLKDVRIRQAISYATDNTAIAAVAGDYKANDSIITANLDKDIGVKMHTYDVAKAKQLLADAGYASGLTLTLNLYQIDMAVKGATVLQSQLKQVGVTLNINTLELATWSSKLGKTDYQMSIVAMTTSDSTVDGVLFGKLSKGGTFSYSNSNVNDWLTQARTVADAASRNDLYKKTCTQIASDAIVVPWFDVVLFYAVNKNLKGYTVNTFGQTGLNKYNTCSW